ncbi:hypothetical protein TELCIR_05298, partial [Teladorsagia circumcincta]
MMRTASLHQKRRSNTSILAVPILTTRTHQLGRLRKNNDGFIFDGENETRLTKHFICVSMNYITR